jgi:hypothetical protein
LAAIKAADAKNKEGVSKAVTFPSLIKVAKGYLRLLRDYYFSNKIHLNSLFPDDSLTAIRKQNNVSPVKF